MLVVTMLPHLRSIQDFINFIKFVDFKVSFTLGFLFHLAPTVLEDFVLDWTGHLWTMELVDPRPFQVVPITLTQGLSHRYFTSGIFSHIGLSACLGMHVCVWSCVAGVNSFFLSFTYWSPSIPVHTAQQVLIAAVTYMKMIWAFKKPACTRQFVGRCQVMRDCLGPAKGICIC